MSDRFYEIIGIADRIVAKYNTRNPFVLAQELDIDVVERNFKKQNGAYNVVLNNDFIFIKQSLCEELKIIVLAHEIGHCILHRDEAIKYGGLKDCNVFDKQNIVMEKEANLFASQVLISDEEVLEMLKLGYNVSQTASALNVDKNLVAIKADVLSAKGCMNNNFEYKIDFMKNIDVKS